MDRDFPLKLSRSPLVLFIVVVFFNFDKITKKLKKHLYIDEKGVMTNLWTMPCTVFVTHHTSDTERRCGHPSALLGTNPNLLNNPELDIYLFHFAPVHFYVCLFAVWRGPMGPCVAKSLRRHQIRLNARHRRAANVGLGDGVFVQQVYATKAESKLFGQNSGDYLQLPGLWFHILLAYGAQPFEIPGRGEGPSHEMGGRVGSGHHPPGVVLV